MSFFFSFARISNDTARRILIGPINRGIKYLNYLICRPDAKITVLGKQDIKSVNFIETCFGMGIESITIIIIVRQSSARSIMFFA